jgi:hypothetical protein
MLCSNGKLKSAIKEIPTSGSSSVKLLCLRFKKFPSVSQRFQGSSGLGIGGPDEAALVAGEFGALGTGGITFAKGAGTDGAPGAESDVPALGGATVAVKFCKGNVLAELLFKVVSQFLLEGGIVVPGGDKGVADRAVNPTGCNQV